MFVEQTFFRIPDYMTFRNDAYLLKYHINQFKSSHIDQKHVKKLISNVIILYACKFGHGII